LMPVGDDRGVTSLALLVSFPFWGGGTELHGSLKLLSSLSSINVAAGQRASKRLSNCAPGWFNSVMRGLTFPFWGDLARRSDLCPWCHFTGEEAMATSALLTGFSLGWDERVAMAMVGGCWGECLVEMIAMSRPKKNNGLVRIILMARPLAGLRSGFPIMGVPVHPRGGGGIGGVCCSL
jgi:hypothetical protein